MTNPVREWWEDLNYFQRQRISNGIILAICYAALVLIGTWLLGHYAATKGTP